MVRKDSRKPLRWPLVALLLLAVSLVAIYRPAVSRALTLATTHQPERFTELYFTDYAVLPKQLVSGQKYAGQFTIANHQADTERYTYQVQVTENDQPVGLTRSSVTLVDGQSVTLPFKYFPSHPGSQLAVVITLDNRPELIRYRAAVVAEAIP